jgi:dienelactone hydrolase
MRVVLVLAEGISWHEYPDAALLCAGGSSWIDILDMDSMDRTDALIEQLVDHEIALLDGQSERLVLMGMSQGGGQSMLRFLRSQRRLGGWVGSVCHVPTAPHTPRHRDPLLTHGQPMVNCDRPIRLLSGESDIVFPPGLVLRDSARLRDVGGFTDVQVEVRSGLAHEGPKTVANLPSLKSSAAAAAQRRAAWHVPDLLFLQKHLPSIVNLTSNPSCDRAEAC